MTCAVCCSVKNGNYGIAPVIDSDLIQTRLCKVNRAVRCSNLEYLICRERPDVKHAGALSQRELSVTRRKRHYVHRRAGIEPGIVACRKRDSGFGSIAYVDPIAQRDRRVNGCLGPALIWLILLTGLSSDADVTIESIHTRCEWNSRIGFDFVALESRK